ncbi:MAG: hypothetical protein WD063_06630 [Pirellulales bacterium]
MPPSLVSMILRLARLAWASPWTCFGLALGAAGLATGGRARRGGGILEFYGGAVGWLLRCLPGQPVAMTLGHVVIGLSRAALDLSRPHELVHVRQYERWGPLFVPAYLACSLVLWLAGKDAYRDNPFERDAYGDHR